MYFNTRQLTNCGHHLDELLASTSPHDILHILPSTSRRVNRVSQISLYSSGKLFLYIFSLYYLLIIMGIMHNLFVPLTSEGVRNLTRLLPLSPTKGKKPRQNTLAHAIPCNNTPRIPERTPGAIYLTTRWDCSHSSASVPATRRYHAVHPRVDR